MDIKDTFLEICNHLSLKQIIGLESLSKEHQQWIRNHNWINILVKLNNTNFEYVINNYSFKKLDLSWCNKITDDSVKYLSNTHTLKLL